MRDLIRALLVAANWLGRPFIYGNGYRIWLGLGVSAGTPRKIINRL